MSTFILIGSDQERVSNPCRAVTKRKRKASDCFRVDLSVVLHSLTSPKRTFASKSRDKRKTFTAPPSLHY